MLKKTLLLTGLSLLLSAPAFAGNSVVDNMRYLEGKIGYYAPDGTNCMRTIGIALTGTPFEGEINVDQAIITGGEYGLLRDPSRYIPRAGDIAVVNNGNHAVMVTEDGGTIQNGESHGGVWESDETPVSMFGSVDCYIETSIYGAEMVPDQGGMVIVRRRKKKPDYRKSALGFSFQQGKEKKELTKRKETKTRRDIEKRESEKQMKDVKMKEKRPSMETFKTFALFDIYRPEKQDKTLLEP